MTEQTGRAEHVGHLRPEVLLGKIKELLRHSDKIPEADVVELRRALGNFQFYLKRFAESPAMQFTALDDLCKSKKVLECAYVAIARRLNRHD